MIATCTCQTSQTPPLHLAYSWRLAPSQSPQRARHCSGKQQLRWQGLQQLLLQLLKGSHHPASLRLCREGQQWVG
jgi:hypothetical protein